MAVHVQLSKQLHIRYLLSGTDGCLRCHKAASLLTIVKRPNAKISRQNSTPSLLPENASLRVKSASTTKYNPRQAMQSKTRSQTPATPDPEHGG